MNPPSSREEARQPAQKMPYVAPTVTDLGAWQSITLQAFSAPIVIPIGPGRGGFGPKSEF